MKLVNFGPQEKKNCKIFLLWDWSQLSSPFLLPEEGVAGGGGNSISKVGNKAEAEAFPAAHVGCF